MTKGIELGFVRANLVAFGVFQTFAYDDNAAAVLGDSFCYLRNKFFFFKRYFRQQDNVRRVFGFAFGEDGAGGNPAGSAAHHFDDAAGAVVSGHAADVRAHFHHGGGVVLDDAAVAGRVIGMRQIVVDGFGHANGPQIVASVFGL